MRDFCNIITIIFIISVKLDQNRFIDWRDGHVDLGLSADSLIEFLWYCHKDSTPYVFKNFDLEKIKIERSYDNYEYNLIIEVFQDFVKGYRNLLMIRIKLMIKTFIQKS